MDNSNQAETTDIQAATEQTDSNDTTTITTTTTSSVVTTSTPSIVCIDEKTTTSIDCDNHLIPANVNVEPNSVANVIGTASDITQPPISTINIDPVTHSVDLETDKNSLLSTIQAQILDSNTEPTNIVTTDSDLSGLDAALDNLTAQVTSLLDENNSIDVKSDSSEAPLDAALATLNSEVLGLLQESRKIQDELKKANDVKDLDSKCGSKIGSRASSKHGSVSGSRGGLNQYFDYSQYRERSISPPPHPLITYKWEDIKRDKEKGRYPWTYLNPQDINEPCQSNVDEPPPDECAIAIIKPNTSTSEQQFEFDKLKLELPVALMPESSPPSMSFNFDNIDTQRAIDSYSVKSSVKNSSSGILEVLQDLEAEEERENERKPKHKENQLKSSTTQSHQDLSTFKPKEESKRFAFRSLLKRAHSAPKKIQITKTEIETETQPEALDDREKSPPHQAQCCHPIVEKLKIMADKQLNKKSTKKPTKSTCVKKVSLKDEKKIVLAEQTRIIRLKDSPKAERKNVAAYLEKRDSDDTVEILKLDESPSETRKRREENRKLDEQDKHDDEEKQREKWQAKLEQIDNVNEKSDFIVSQSLTGSDTEPTVEEILEEEFKNGPPKKAPRKTKEHVYEDIEVPGAISSYTAGKLGKPANLFASAVLHSVLNKEEFKEGLKRQNQIEDVEVENFANEPDIVVDVIVSTNVSLPQDCDGSAKPVPEEVIDLKPAKIEHIEQKTEQTEANVSNEIKSNVKITIENMDEDISIDETDENVNSLTQDRPTDTKKDVFIKDEKKVKFSQSTEERYQEKLAAEKGPDKEDVELPDHIQVSKRWTNMCDHEYEPIGEPIDTSMSEKPVVKITEPETTNTETIHVDENIDEYAGGESPIRSITPYTDISRTEDIHTSQVDDSVIEELPLRREDRKKKSFMTNAGEHTKNLQNKISSQASSLRTKFKRSLKSSGNNGQKASGSNLKTSLKSSPKTSQTSPKERKKFKRIDFTNKIKSIHMPKMSKPELPKFKVPDKFKLSRSEAHSDGGPMTTTATITSDETFDEPSSSALGTGGTPTIVSCTTEEICETKYVPKKRFEFGSYPKIFNRLRSQSKTDEHDVTDVVSEETDRDTATQPSSSSFSTHFATVPRAAKRIKNSIISKWNKTSFSQSTDRDECESIPHGSQIPHDDMREDSVERRIRMASKIESMDDEEEPLGILQTKEQIQLANYDEENRAIHEISRAREQEFKARKPLIHQDSDLVSDESNRDIDWEECERMRNKIIGTQHHTPADKFEEYLPKKGIHHSRRPRTDSNFSTEETQSSGSSGDRRRTGVIEDIDDDEFFLRERGVSQDNAEISKYISSAIREGINDNRPYPGYSYDNNNEFVDEFRHYEQRPRKPLRRRNDGFNRSFESYDDYRHENLSDNEIPVATQYFPRHEDDENISFYDNDFNDDLNQPNILSRDHYDSDVDNTGFHAVNVQPEVPKRRRKGHPISKQDSIETNEEVLIYRSEPSFSVPDVEPLNDQFIVKPMRKNRSISSKSDIMQENRESMDRESATIERFSPNNSRYTINIKGTNGYATVKKEPPERPPAPARRRKRSTKSLGAVCKDSPFPERQKRSVITPLRPPRRGSSSSLIDQHKPPSIAPSDGTQYEEIDDELEDDENEFYPHKMQNRPLPPPPRPPRDKRRHHKSDIDKKFDDNDDAGAVAGSFDDAGSEFSTREFIGTEMATQTSMDIEDLYLNEDDLRNVDMPTEQYSQTVEEILRNSNVESTPHGTFKTSDDNLTKGIQKFRESNQRSYSERSRASTDRQPSRPITPSALVVEQRIARSPVQTDATLFVQPVENSSNVKSDFRTDSTESEYVPYADEVDDTHLDTEDERIINAAIQRYQMLGNDLDGRDSIVRESTPHESLPKELDDQISTTEVPQPPPRRKSSASTAQVPDTIDVPLAEAETLSIASTQELNRITPEMVTDLSTENNPPIPHAQVDSLTVVNIHSSDRAMTEPQEQNVTTPMSTLEITPAVMQEIIERVRETLPVQLSEHPPSPVQEDIVEKSIVETVTPVRTKSSEESKVSEEPPKRPPTPTDYTLTSEVPASFYRLRSGISDDESVPSIPPATLPKHRPRKHPRRPESSSDDECNRHPRHSHHPTRGQDLSIADLSGQLIRACGRALSSSLNTAGHSIIDFLRSLTKNQDDQQKDLSLVLVILIVIVASLMMLGISGDRSVHHHHWNFLNPPDNVGRR